MTLAAQFILQPPIVLDPFLFSMRSLASSLFYRLLFVSVSCSQSPRFGIYRLVVATGDSDNHSSLFPSLPLSRHSPRLSKGLSSVAKPSLRFSSSSLLFSGLGPLSSSVLSPLVFVIVLALQVPSLFVLGIVLALGFLSRSVPGPFAVSSRGYPSSPHFMIHFLRPSRRYILLPYSSQRST